MIPVRAGVVAAAALLATAVPATAQVSFEADVSCRWGAIDCNRPARNLVSQFRSLRDHGDLIGFHLGRAPGVSLTKHWQGVQRLTAEGGRLMAISRSGKNVSYVIVRMASRDRSGERYRSNRIGSRSALEAPPARDRVVTAVRSDEGFDHSGGLQSAGRYLAVGLEEGLRSSVAFWDLRDPRKPRRVGTLVRPDAPPPPKPPFGPAARASQATGVKGAGTVSLAKLRDGRHLLIVGAANANTLDFYVSRAGTTLAKPVFDHTARWNESELVGGDSEFGNYQNLALVAGTNGRLYLIGTHRNVLFGPGQDYADLFALERSPGSPRIRKLAARHLYCKVPGRRQCNLDAAGGAYVTRSGGLLLYGTEHDNVGPGASVRAEEFRPAPHRSTCADIDQAWVELYDDTGFDGDRSVMIDYADRRKRDYENYDLVERFEDKASAGRWCLPRGRRYRLYEDKDSCGGKTVDLIGTGRPDSDRKFSDASGPVRRFGDDVSCSRWIGG